MCTQVFCLREISFSWKNGCVGWWYSETIISIGALRVNLNCSPYYFVWCFWGSFFSTKENKLFIFIPSQFFLYAPRNNGFLSKEVILLLADQYKFITPCPGNSKDCLASTNSSEHQPTSRKTLRFVLIFSTKQRYFHVIASGSHTFFP